MVVEVNSSTDKGWVIYILVREKGGGLNIVE
jgi:hypothetical protein